MPNEAVAAAQIQELQRIQKTTLVWRIGLAVVLLVVVLASLGTLNSAVKGLAEPGPTQTEFTTLMGERMKNDIIPAAQDIAQDTIRGIDLPGSVERLNKRAPDVAEKAMSEVRLLADNIPQRGQKVLAAEFESALSQQEEKLKKFEAGISEEKLKTITTNLIELGKTEVTEISQELFTEHVQALNGIMADLIKIETIEAPNVQRDIPTWEMVFLLTDIVRDDFKMTGAGGTTTTATATSATTGKKEK